MSKSKNETADQLLEAEIKKVEKILEKTPKLEKPVQEFFSEDIVEECQKYRAFECTFSLSGLLADTIATRSAYTALQEANPKGLPLGELKASGRDRDHIKVKVPVSQMIAEIEQEIFYRANLEARRDNEQRLQELKRYLSDEQREQRKADKRAEQIKEILEKVS